ncbi:hypothetical protein NliqN6_4713 [Naganishia liquefaciens]|uniref:Uncharacterized protein n=1 Tax=Naganishia liquefaciens TaxID=104408 RepID=A0A8H3TWR3_9TREE|nr:hypothetical protein NliqN6_4713 [Naganishia liquefaciens]
MSESSTAHSCFQPPLPALPIGYKFDPQQPMKLVPFRHFQNTLKLIDICKKCSAHALTNFHFEVVNKVSAERTASSPAAASLGNTPRYTGMVNSCTHPMFNKIYPPALREGRRVAAILGHEARRGKGSLKPRLSYVIKYQFGTTRASAARSVSPNRDSALIQMYGPY